MTANALAFLPARSKVQNALLTIANGGYVTITATDTYTVGQDSCEVGEVGETTIEVEVDREGLQAIDKAARGDKKKQGHLEIFNGDCVKYTGTEGNEAVAHATQPDYETWNAIQGLLTSLEKRAVALPQVIAFDPSLLMRFSKVKADKTERIADFFITDAWAPVLVKIGTTFTGAIMPIEREVHSNNVGPDGLWQ